MNNYVFWKLEAQQTLKDMKKNYLQNLFLNAETSKILKLVDKTDFKVFNQMLHINIFFMINYQQ